MSRKKPKQKAEPEERAGQRTSLAGLGLLVAIVLPYVLYSAGSDESLRESKIPILALGSALALLGARSFRLGLRSPLPLLLGALGLAALSAATTGARWVDPALSAPLLAALALLFAGSSDEGDAARDRVSAGLMLAGAATGLLAFGQRFLDFWRLPISVPPSDARFLATAFLGNPGDVAAALVFPALLLWIDVERLAVELRQGRAAGPPAGNATGSPKARLVVRGLGLIACLAGFYATAAVGPILAFGAGVSILVLLDLRRRARPYALGAGTVVVAVALGAGLLGLLRPSVGRDTGALDRIVTKVKQLASGDLSSVLTQRDIGILAAKEMVTSHPLLGIGPGAFENAFVPARIAAEERTRRRLVHLSEYAHFENAHSEPLTIAAECGLPALALSLAFCVALLASLARRRSDPEAATLLVLLGSFFVLCLGGFPLRLAILVGPAAYLAGRALRVGGGDESRPVRRLVVAPFALAVLLLGLARWLAVSLQAAGEDSIRSANSAEGSAKREILVDAKRSLTASLALRPRKPQTWLALASAERLLGDPAAAERDMLRSFALEERAETDVNLGVLSLIHEQQATDAKEKLRRAEEAMLLFRRATWILPRLLELLPEQAQPAEIKRYLDATEKALPATGTVPPLPEGLRLRL